MLKIEIWKCKPGWLTAPAQERNTIVKRFTSVVQRHLDDTARADGGPFWVEKPTACLLIWTWETRNEEMERAYEELRLRSFFEPLVDVRANPGLTARGLANRLGIK
jgi:hypothetical protein